MINKEQLKTDGYAIECWFNVYSDYSTSFKYAFRESCIRVSVFRKPLYRIHVKLK